MTPTTFISIGRYDILISEVPFVPLLARRFDLTAASHAPSVVVKSAAEFAQLIFYLTCSKPNAGGRGRRRPWTWYGKLLGYDMERIKVTYIGP